jgi:hypothetical protein
LQLMHLGMHHVSVQSKFTAKHHFTNPRFQQISNCKKEKVLQHK